MVIVHLVGGLGNQLFQYAAARRLANMHGSCLKLDISAFQRYTLHPYHLGHFCIIENIATKDEIIQITGDKSLAQDSRGSIIKEKNFKFDPDLLNVPDNVYLVGYWQSEKYFDDIKDIIRSEFSVKDELDSKNKDIADCITNCNSVSLHIRRGDYINNPKTNLVHGTCSMDYYRRCILKIGKNIHKPHFFIFTDDPEWVAKNMKLEFPMTLIDHNGPARDYEDLRLMSMCQHNIIANSTFSWWGAWLNPNPDKIVFIPERWFQKETIDTRDLTLDNWEIV